MDRDRIERRDFPTGRRGYDPAAVDEHLRRVADEFESRAHPPAPSMASSTSEQVRLILQAAEDGAAELRAAAGSEASDHVTRVQTAADGMLTKLDALEAELARLLEALRASGERLVEGLAELQSEAESTHPRAATEPPVPQDVDGGAAGPPPEHPPRRAKPIRPRPPGLAAPPEQAQSQVPQDAGPEGAGPKDAGPQDAGLKDAGPTGADPTGADSQGSGPKDGPKDAGPTGVVPQDPESRDVDSRNGTPAPDSPPLSAPGAPDWPAPADALFADAPAEDALFAPPEEDFAADAPPAESDAESDDASARLIALNMALNGSSRDDTRVFLAEHFSLPDLEALLDDVYARAGR